MSTQKSTQSTNGKIQRAQAVATPSQSQRNATSHPATDAIQKPKIEIPPPGEQAQEPPPTQFTPDEINRLWQRLMYEGTQHTNRVSFYLVAQSMFFAAFASNQRPTLAFPVICAAAGIIISAIWMKMARDQDVMVKRTRAILSEQCMDFKALADPVRKTRITRDLLSVYLPIIMIILWTLALLGDITIYATRVSAGSIP